MGDRVYPRDSPPFSGEHPIQNNLADESPPVSGEHQRRMSQDSFASSKMSYGNGNGNGNGYGYGPNPGTYVVQVPKDRVFRVPPPENEHKFKLYTKKSKSKRSCCRCCICSIISTILLLILLIGITIGIIYLVYHPKKPTYNITSVHVKGVNLTTASNSNADATTITPVFNVTFNIHNPNAKIGIYYEQGSEVSVYRDGVNLCEGKLPAFYQPPNSVTVLSTELSGAGMVLSKDARDKLITQQKNGKVPLEMDVTIPVKVKLGSLKLWTFTVKVTCDVTLSALKADAKVVSKSCKVHTTPW